MTTHRRIDEKPPRASAVRSPVLAPVSLIGLCVGCFAVSRPLTVSPKLLLTILLSTFAAALAGLVVAVVGGLEMGEWYSSYSLPAFAAMIMWGAVLLARANVPLAVAAGLATAVLVASGVGAMALPVIGALVGAVLIAAVIGSRVRPGVCAWIVVGLCVFDLMSFRAGLLERIVFAGASDVPLHSLASVTVGEWTIGSGDLLAAALVGIAARGTLTARRSMALGLVILPLGLAFTFWIAASHDTPIPATLPMALAALAVLLLGRFREPAARHNTTVTS